MRKSILLLLTLLSPLATMFKSNNVFAADPPQSEYDAAMATITNGMYYLTTDVSGTTFYVTSDGHLTSEKDYGCIFNISKVSGGGLYDIGILIDPGNGAHFTNTTLNGNKANLHPSSPCYCQDSGNNRNDWERQVFYLNAETGKYTIRSCNTAYGESSWADAGRAFWTYEIEDSEVNLTPIPCYSYEPAYVWMLEKPSAFPQILLILQSITDDYGQYYYDSEGTSLNMGYSNGQRNDFDSYAKLRNLVGKILVILEKCKDSGYSSEEDSDFPTLEQAEAWRVEADSLYEKVLDSVIKSILITTSIEGVRMEFEVISAKEKTCRLSWVENFRYKGAITIPSQVDGYNVIKIAGNWSSIFEAGGNLTDVTIPSSVVTLGCYAFSGCYGLTSITIPASVTKIEEYAFSGCSKLTSITIPSGVTSIESYTFSGCSGLTRISLSENISRIGRGAFDGCTNLSVLEFASIESLCNLTLDDSYTWRLTCHLYINGVELKGEVVIPEGVTSIKRYVFYTDYITSLSISSTVKSIGKEAFYLPIGANIICRATTPPILEEYAFGTRVAYKIKECYCYVPRASINSYKNADGWKYFDSKILAIEDTEGKPDITSHNLNLSHPAYYDYDGDGVMEMFALYKEDGNQCFGLMNDDYLLKSIAVDGFRNDIYKYMICDNNVPKIANGNGDINIGNLMIRNDGTAEDVAAKIASSYSDYARLLFMDYDNDGHLDAAKESTIMVQQHDGSFLRTILPITQDSAYVAYLKATAPTFNPLSFNNVVSGQVATSSTSGFSQAIDLNRDGWLDLLSIDGKSAFLSLGNNEYYQVGFNGNIHPYDLDGDGILDYILYDGEDIYTVLCEANGRSSQKKIFSNKNIKTFVCRDFDHDDDVDVLAYITDGTNTYFVFMRNDGNGSFKKKETYLENCHTFIECKDYDADGFYEVLLSPLWMNFNGNTYGTNLPVNKIIKINKDFTLEDVSENLIGSSSMMIMNLGDYNNDGYTEFKLVNGSVHVRAGSDIYNYHEVAKDVSNYFTGHYTKQITQNTAPSKMNKPSVMLDENTGFLRIVWERGQDAETSVCDLTYEVRVGTESGKSDVLCAPSLADGRRRVVADGAMGTQLQMLFNIAKHPEGTYYIAVQAIDAGGLGGAWSDEAIYENVYIAPNILAENTLTTTVDTITVVADGFNESITYQWSVSNGEVISQESNKAKVIFHVAGAQQVGLTTIYNGTKFRSNPLDINVLPFKEIKNESGYNFNYLRKSLDLNQDGYPDGFGYNSYFEINDGKGNLTKYPKSFNSDLTLYDPTIFDYNMDGAPDVTAGNGNIFINDEEGDFECVQKRFVTTDGNDFSLNGELVDFTNTGICYVVKRISQGSLNPPKFRIFGTNDYATFDFVTEISNIEYILDINHDGFMDFFGLEGGGKKFYAFLNNGDGTFNKILLLELEDGCSGHLADINNDGYMDIITGGYTSSYFGQTSYYFRPLNIYLGNADNKYTVSKSIGSYCEIGTIRDYDNNGYSDIPVSYKNGSSTIFFDHDMQYHIVEGDCSSSPFVVMDGNGYPQGRNRLAMSTIQNEAPKAPSTVSVRQTTDGMVINWSDAEDDHTPALQMRYNVSVKRKGKTGEGSYVISPMNGGDSKAALVFPWYYKQSTTMTVPNSALSAGETYEVQVQAIDLWNQWSPMTEPVEITISAEGGMIDVPDMACVGRETKVKYTGVLGTNTAIDFGTDSKYTRNGNTFNVTWTSEGVKEIAIGSHCSQIIVKQPIDVSFTFPEEVFVGSLPINISKEMKEQNYNGGFRFVSYPRGARTSVTYTPAEGKVWLEFDKSGQYEIESFCNDDVRGNSLCLSFEVLEAPMAEIRSVDAIDGHFNINWATSNLPSSIHKVVVYKEGNRVNQFNVLDTVNVSIGQYLDKASSPNIVSERYKIGLLTDGGQIIESKIHKPLHVMIASTATGGYNLMWNAYEGLMVDNYRIWRGTSPDKLELLAQLPGSQQSFTDSNAPTNEVFYAVSFTPVESVFVRVLHRAPSVGGDVCSNVVSTKSASAMVLANSLSIVTLMENPTLTADFRTLQLYPILLPTYCTYNKVSWSIVEGEELAEISSNGVLTAKEGRGNVRVRASSLDGSNLTDEITVYVDVLEYIKGDVNNDGHIDVADLAGVVRFILEYDDANLVFKAADMDESGVVEVNDYSAVVKVILNHGEPSAASQRRVNADKNSVISLSDVYLNSNSEGELVVRMDKNDMNYTGLQFDLCLPEGVELMEEGVKAIGNQHCAWSQMSIDGTYRVICASMMNDELREGVVLRLQIKVLNTVNDDMEVVASDVVLSDIYAVRHDVASVKASLKTDDATEIHSIDNGQLSIDNSVYNLSGQRVQKMNKGIYIVNGKKNVIK